MTNLNVWKSKVHRLPCFAILLLALISGLFASSANGQGQRTWTNTTGIFSGWNNPLNWTPLGAPGENDDAFFFFFAGEEFGVAFSDTSPGGTVSSLSIVGDQNVFFDRFLGAGGGTYLVRANELTTIDGGATLNLLGVNLSSSELSIGSSSSLRMGNVEFGSVFESSLIVDNELSIGGGARLDLFDNSSVTVGGTGILNSGVIFAAGNQTISGDVTNTLGNLSAGVELGSGATLNITGSYNGAAIANGANNDELLTLSGEYHPANADTQLTGTVTYGGISLSLAPSSTTFIQLGSATDFDQVRIIGDSALAPNLSISGNLDVELINGFEPTVGQTFEIIDFLSSGTFSGEFANVADGDVALAGNGFNLVAHYTDGGITLVTQSTAMPPANDNLVDSIAISNASFPVSVNGNNVDATDEAGETTGGNGNNNTSVWWNIVAPANGSMTIDTVNSNFDTTLDVFADAGGGFGGLTSEGFNDDISGGILQSNLTFQAVAGQAYQIRVAGFSSAEGDITVNVDFVPDAVAPANDEWANTIQIANSSFPVTVMGTNMSGTVQADEQELTQTGATVWWFIDTPEDGTFTIDTFGSDYDTQLHIYEFPSSQQFVDLVPVVNNDDANGSTTQSEVTFQAVSGQCYEIRVGGFDNDGGGNGSAANQGNITLNVNFEPSVPFVLGDVDCNGVVNLLDVAPFVDLISNGMFDPKADIDDNGVVNLLDVEPFITLIGG